jgi:hypothetical protein
MGVGILQTVGADAVGGALEEKAESACAFTVAGPYVGAVGTRECSTVRVDVCYIAVGPIASAPAKLRVPHLASRASTGSSSLRRTQCAHSVLTGKSTACHAVSTIWDGLSELCADLSAAGTGRADDGVPRRAGTGGCGSVPD